MMNAEPVLGGIGFGRKFFRTGFLKKEDGTATVEAVIWLPLFFLVLFLMVDAAMIFAGQSQALRVVQDANRNMSIGRFRTAAETEAYIEQQLARLSAGVNAISTVTAGVVTTTVSLPARDLQFSGFFIPFMEGTLSVSADHLIEDWEATTS
jgi:Flp pilus assembly protein TadG